MEKTVTVYRLAEEGILRQVLCDCFYRYEDGLDKEGFTRKFLLISTGAFPLCPGDRIYDGEGPQIMADQWDTFLPETVPGLSVAAYATARYLGERFHHWEAGRKG